MQIFLHFIDGHQEIVQITSETNIEQIKAIVNTDANIQLVCNGMILSSLFELEQYSNVFVNAALEGGKKKKKKKAYTTKKKNKHIHKKVKLHTLALYGVDNKGTVTYSRKNCPNCGPGIFMGKHWDRYYCGTCHTTIKMDAQTIRQNEQILKKKKAALEAEKKAKEKEAADKAPAAKGGKKDAKGGKKGKK